MKSKIVNENNQLVHVGDIKNLLLERIGAYTVQIDEARKAGLKIFGRSSSTILLLNAQEETKKILDLISEKYKEV